jgi:hypothetical protein
VAFPFPVAADGWRTFHFRYVVVLQDVAIVVAGKKSLPLGQSWARSCGCSTTWYFHFQFRNLAQAMRLFSHVVFPFPGDRR